MQLPANRKTLVAQMPAFTVDLPWHQIFRLGLKALQIGLKRRYSFLKKLAKSRRIDLAKSVNEHRDRLPGAFMIGNPNALFVPVNFQPWRVVQRQYAKPLHQVGLFEGVFADAEDEPRQPFHAGHGVQKPALAFILGSNLDDAAMVPVCWAELTQFVNALVDPI